MRRVAFALISIGVCFACGSGDGESHPRDFREIGAHEPANTVAQAQGANDVRPPPEQSSPLVRGQRSMMGTVFQISVANVGQAQATPAIEAALDEIARLEAVLSEWQPTSEVSAINAGAGGAATIVSEDTWTVVNAGLEVSRWSDGAFDLSWAALRGLYTFQPGQRNIPGISEVAERLARIDWHAIAVDPETHSVRLERPTMAIGTGGIAKGYALDRAASILQAAGLNDYMLFGGGQVQVHGQRGNRPWRVGIQHPRDPRSYIAYMELTESSVSTSGDYEHAFVDETGRHWHHIIDLSTGLPAANSMQVTLLTERGLYADALSTAVFVLGPEAGLRMLSVIPGSPQAVIIDPDLRLWATPEIRRQLIMNTSLTDGKLPGDPRFR